MGLICPEKVQKCNILTFKMAAISGHIPGKGTPYSLPSFVGITKCPSVRSAVSPSVRPKTQKRNWKLNITWPHPEIIKIPEHWTLLKLLNFAKKGEISNHY